MCSIGKTEREREVIEDIQCVFNWKDREREMKFKRKDRKRENMVNKRHKK